MIPMGPTQFKDFDQKIIEEKLQFEELIGVLVDEKCGFFLAYARMTNGRFFCAHLTETGPDSFQMRPWCEVEEAASLATAMEGGNDWDWIHKDIDPNDNWQFMKKSVAWAIASHRGLTVTGPEMLASFMAKQVSQEIDQEIVNHIRSTPNNVYTIPEWE